MATSCPRLAGRYSPAGGYAGRVAHSPANAPTNGTKAHSKQTIHPPPANPVQPRPQRPQNTQKPDANTAPTPPRTPDGLQPPQTREHGRTHRPGRLAAPRPQQKPRARGKRKAPAETYRRGKTILFSSSRPTKHIPGKAAHTAKTNVQASYLIHCL